MTPNSHRPTAHNGGLAHSGGMILTGRAVITEESVPRVAPGGRVRYDKQRDQWVILAPERLFVLDPIAHEVIKRCDGAATFSEIVDSLVAQFAADREVVSRDVQDLLQSLADKRILTLCAP